MRRKRRKIQTTESPWRGERERERFSVCLFSTNPPSAEHRRAERRKKQNRSRTNTYSSYDTPVVLQSKYKFTCFGGLEKPHMHVCMTMKQRRVN